MTGTCSNGHANAAGAQFCGTCGLAISDKPPLPGPAPVPAPPASPTWATQVPSAPGYPPPPAPYAAPTYPYATGQARVQSRNGMGTASLILGILAVIFCLIVGALSFILGVLAIIFGGVGIARANRGEATNKSAAGWGLGLGIASIGVLVLAFVVYLAAV